MTGLKKARSPRWAPPAYQCLVEVDFPVTYCERALGVLIDPLSEREFELGRSPEHTYAHLGLLGPTWGRTLFFTPNGINVRENSVAGWHFDGSEWKRMTAPLPNAIYNRLARRSLERRPTMQRLLDQIRINRLLFNPGFLAKDEALSALGAKQVATPRFAVVQDVDDAMSALRSWGVVYLKPKDGSLGRGIVRIEPGTAQGRGNYLITSNRATPDPPLQTLCGRRTLSQLLGDLVRSTPYIAQEGVDLPSIDGCRVDLRALVQRTEAGWSLTGVTGRAAPPGHVSTHTVRGGHIVPFAEVADMCGIDRGAVESLVCRAALAIEESRGEEFFEFSADIAPTADGRLAILEMNAKPFPFDEDEIRTLAARRLFKYAWRPKENGARPIAIG